MLKLISAGSTPSASSRQSQYPTADCSRASGSDIGPSEAHGSKAENRSGAAGASGGRTDSVKGGASVPGPVPHPSIASVVGKTFLVAKFSCID